MNDKEARRYENPAEGLRALEDAFGYWTSKITELSFQYCLGLIAANWAVHAKDVLSNSLAVWSIAVAIGSLCLSLLGALVISEMVRCEYYVAVKDRHAWGQRWEASERIDSEWPYTKTIDFWARLFGWLRFILPLLAGVLFVLGVIVR